MLISRAVKVSIYSYQLLSDSMGYLWTKCPQVALYSIAVRFATFFGELFSPNIGQSSGDISLIGKLWRNRVYMGMS